MLGKPESAYLLNPHLAEITWRLAEEERAYEHFTIPFVLATTALYSKIRNFKIRLLPPNELIQREIEKYDQGGLHYEEKPLVNSLMFIRCKESWLISFKKDHPQDFLFYRSADSKRPGPIDDEEMRMFMFVTSADHGRNLHYFGEDSSVIKAGQRVRVTGGIYKGAEGYIKRIKKDRKLIVAVSGVAVVAVSYIPIQYLEKREG